MEIVETHFLSICEFCSRGVKWGNEWGTEKKCQKLLPHFTSTAAFAQTTAGEVSLCGDIPGVVHT